MANKNGINTCKLLQIVTESLFKERVVLLNRDTRLFTLLTHESSNHLLTPDQ